MCLTLYFLDSSILKNWIKKKILGPHCAAQGMLVPQPGLGPSPPAVKVQSPNHWTTMEVPSKE